MAPPNDQIIPFPGPARVRHPKPRIGQRPTIIPESTWRPTVLLIDSDLGQALSTARALDRRGFSDLGQALSTARALDRRGFRAIVADRPDRALAYLRAVFVYGVILNPLAPGIDGFEFARVLASDPRLRLVGVVIYCEPDEAHLIGAAIPDAEMIARPADPDVLASAVRRAVAATLSAPVPAPIVLGSAS